jgi:beta-barrel assembly-enhancing protease
MLTQANQWFEHKKFAIFHLPISILQKVAFCILLSFFIHCEGIVNTLISDKQDVKIGRSMDAEIRKSKKKYKVLNNKHLQSYVQKIVNTVLKSPLVKKKGVYPYKVTIIDDDETINAFCTPGGFIYVYTGLLKALPNEASLAAVLGHEIAHAEKRHARQRMLASIGIMVIIQMILSDNTSAAKEIGAQLIGNMAILANSRSDESESDELSFRYLQSTPYYPGAMKYFFEVVAPEKGTSVSVGRSIQGLLSTHPLPESRLRNNNARIKKAKLEKPSEANLFQARYKTILDSLL